MKKVNLLSRAEMKKVMGRIVNNPNCGETNPVADYSCCLSNSVYNVGETDCENASTICTRAGGSMITSDPGRCNVS